MEELIKKILSEHNKNAFAKYEQQGSFFCGKGCPDKLMEAIQSHIREVIGEGEALTENETNDEYSRNPVIQFNRGWNARGKEMLRRAGMEDTK